MGDTLNPKKQRQLYDVVTDRTETIDRAAKHPERVATMAAACTAWAKALGRKLPGHPGKNTD